MKNVNLPMRPRFVRLTLALIIFLNGFLPAINAQNYCVARGTFPWEQWIEQLSVSNTVFSTTYPQTGKDGYGNFTAVAPATLFRGVGNLLTLNPKSSWMGDPRNGNLYWRVWVDFNADGDFTDAGEQVVSRQIVWQSQLFFDNESAFTPPANVRTGTTRLRVAMKFGSSPEPCETFARGEVEDYTVIITDRPQNDAPDLVVENITASPVFAIGLGNTLGYNVRNAGTAAANNISSRVYLSTDNQLSTDDLLLRSDFLPTLLVGENALRSHQIEIPSTWTYTNSFLIVQILPLSNEINVANNAGSIGINILLPVVPTCGNALGSGRILCYAPSADGSTQVVIADNNVVFQKTLDKNGRTVGIAQLGNLAQDSILVKNNQVVKKLANGSTAYVKNIAPSVLSRVPNIDAALEMPDGSFVLAGFQKSYDPSLASGSRDSLVLVATDAALNYLDQTVEARNQGTAQVLYDTCYQLLRLPNNQFVVRYGIGQVGLVTVSNHNLSKYLKTNNNLRRLKSSGLGIGAPKSVLHTMACGNNLIFTIDGSRYSIKSNFIGTEYAVFNLDSLVPLTLREVGQGTTDYYGVYRTYSYYYRPSLRDTAYALSANYAGDPRLNLNSFARLEVRFLNNAAAVATHIKNVAFVPYEHIVRTGDTTCLILGTQNGALWAWNPDCGGASPTYCGAISAAPWEMWVSKVTFGAFNNASGKFKDYSVAGYSDYTDKTATVVRGQTYPLSILPGLSWAGYLPNVYCRVWIDFNNNKVFENGELVLEKSNANPLINNVLIPNSAAVGQVRMRVAVKWGAYPTACEAFERGEVEDYTVNIQAAAPADLAVELQSIPAIIAQPYSVSVLRITARNVGTQVLSNVKIKMPFGTRMVTGGVATPSAGTWQEWCAGGVQCCEWTIPSLNAGGVATLDIPVYIGSLNPDFIVEARVVATTPNDDNADNNVAQLTIGSGGTPLGNGQLAHKSPTFRIPLVIRDLFPNPTEGDLAIGLESLMAQDVTFDVVSTLGQTVFSTQRRLEKGFNQVKISLWDLPQGVYFVQTNVGTGRGVPLKFVKM